MHNRSLRKNKFNLPSMRELWWQIGKYDALVEFMECAIRQFYVKYDSQSAGSDFRNFLIEESKAVGVHLHSFSLETYQEDIYKSYLIHPYGCMDVFVDEFVQELRPFGLLVSLDFQNKNKLDKLVLGLKKAGVIVTVEDYKLQVDAYYRRSRNFSAHKLSEDERGKIQSLFESVDRKKMLEVYPSLSQALLGTDRFTFDDYLLCTANLKNIADTLTTDVFPAINWQNYKIQEDMPHCVKVRGFQGDEMRKLTFIQKCISTKYGVSLDLETDCKVILDNLESL